MESLEELQERVRKLEERNQRVEGEKAWETSWTRRGLLVLFTYLAVAFYLQAIQVPNPWLNAIVPSLGFLLSTLSLPYFRRLWLQNREKKGKAGI